MTTIITENVTGTGDAVTIPSVQDLIVAPDVLLTSTEASGIVATDGLNRITVHGTILADLWGVRIGDGPEFTLSSLVIGPDATVSSRFEAISTHGEDISVVNAGFISGYTAVHHVGGDNLSLTNTGQIVAVGAAFLAGDDGIRLANYGTMISSMTNAVTLDGANVTIINDGTITGNGAAISTFGAARIVNSGHLDGGVSMIGQGESSYDGSLGTVTGLVQGGDRGDTILGGSGIEVVDGGGGGDIIAGGGGDDTLSGAAGQDLLRGQAGDDIITGGTDDDQIYGGRGDDTLRGGSGNDSISGGEGDDTQTGFSGSDTFVFRWDGGNDIITDFENNIDKLDLTAFGFESVAEVRSFAWDTSSGMLIYLSFQDGGSILLEDFSKADFWASDVLI